MDKSNLSDLRERCPPHFRQKLGLFLSRSQSGLEEVPDPYWSGTLGFELVLDLAEEVCGRLSMSLSIESSKGVFRNYVDS